MNRVRTVVVFVSIVVTFILSVASPSINALHLNVRSETRAKRPTQVDRSRLVGSGEVRPNRYVKIKSDIAGRVEHIHVEPGADVANGQALFVIAASGDKKSLTKYSPLRGIVADISTRVGETITSDELPERTLMTIADMSTIYVEVNVDGSDISRVAVGRTARVVVDAFHKAKILGFVTRKDPKPVGPSDAPEYRVTIRIAAISNPIRKLLRPGMSATAWISPASKK